jgi:hypothetical protein
MIYLHIHLQPVFSIYIFHLLLVFAIYIFHLYFSITIL